jgi:hypothetical protein
MTDQRRYGETEVAEIFRYAASPRASDGHAPATESGFSLAELQSIGAEAGIAPERVAEAAAELDVHRVAVPRRRTHLGMPVAVGRTVDLPRAPTDREWEMLLADLREAFGARGKDRSSGGVRAWTNGNLHAYVEPTEAGYRLRLGSVKGTAVATSQMGVASLIAGLVLSVLLFAEVLDEDLVVLLVFSLMGAIALAMNAIRLPRWADAREEQMERIAARVRVLIA